MTDTGADFAIVDQRELESSEIEGYRSGSPGISLILVDMPPGSGVRLHRHAYGEVFVVQEGRATYRVGSATVDVTAPRVLIVRAGVPHGFVNSGDGQLRQVDIHLNDRIITEWLED
jgi:mannose-6-phosphate isomerase-like protein (cupin superfamily)